MEIITGGNTSIFAGSDEITKVYQGSGLIWEKNEGPAWPKNYYYPYLSFWNNYGRGIGYWKNHFNSGETATIYFDSDDCEGEGGDWYFTYIAKTTGQTLNVDEMVNPDGKHLITANTDSNYFWLMPYSHYEAQNKAVPTFWNECTALCYRQQEGGCGTDITFPSDADMSNIELIVNISPDYYYFNSFGDWVRKCPNLKYISNGTLTGSTDYTLTLTGSTAWTAESMKFTEWYCPGTTFIIEDNSYWRSIIDWDIAAKRNITFKDGNGNIITQ